MQIPQTLCTRGCCWIGVQPLVPAVHNKFGIMQTKNGSYGGRLCGLTRTPRVSQRRAGRATPLVHWAGLIQSACRSQDALCHAGSIGCFRLHFRESEQERTVVNVRVPTASESIPFQRGREAAAAATSRPSQAQMSRSLWPSHTEGAAADPARP